MSKMKKFLDERKKSAPNTVAKADPMDSSTKRIAGKIQRHNQAKLHSFAKTHKDKVSKSIDFHETTVAVDSMDQMLAEKTTNPELLNYLKTSVESDITKIPFSKGMLTLSQKEPGLYNAFFQDSQGQIVEKFDSQTLQIIAKNMELKNLYSAPVPNSSVAPNHDAVEEMEDRAIAQQEAIKVVSQAHDRIDMVQRQLNEQSGKAKSLKVRFGDFELELRKSIKDFVNDFKKSRTVDETLLRKSLRSWKKRAGSFANISTEADAARHLLENWEQYQEDFCQIVYAMQQSDSGNE